VGLSWARPKEIDKGMNGINNQSYSSPPFTLLLGSKARGHSRRFGLLAVFVVYDAVTRHMPLYARPHPDLLNLKHTEGKRAEPSAKPQTKRENSPSATFLPF